MQFWYNCASAIQTLNPNVLICTSKIIYLLYVLALDTFIRNVSIFCYLLYIYLYQNLSIIKRHTSKPDTLFNYKLPSILYINPFCIYIFYKTIVSDIIYDFSYHFLLEFNDISFLARCLCNTMYLINGYDS